MKYICLLALIVSCMVMSTTANAVTEASLAWFTDASIISSSKTAKPANAPPAVPGAIYDGVALTSSVGIDDPLLAQQHGMISFWIKPNWNGSDNVEHKFLRIGDPTINGLQIEKSAHGMMRFVMAGGGKVTAARYDVSNWAADKWHHIVCSWIDKDSKPLGLCLWIDKVCVDSVVWGGDSFMNPSTMSDKKAYIGDTATDATMDELIFRGNVTGTYGPGQIDMVYRDYFRTAPYTAIKIDDQPHIVKSDLRVVKGSQKQFGLMALMEGKWVRITDFAVRYGNWGDIDAKPFISWTTSNTSIATVDNSSHIGRVTGVNTGHANLIAWFRNMSATRDVEVISSSQPDIDVMYVERTPRYEWDAAKKWPSEGELVHSIAHISNYGYTNLPAGTIVKFELVPDTNGNFLCDAEEIPSDTRTATINKPLGLREETTVTFDWAWTMSPTFVRVTVDPDNVVSELCEANNQRCELNTARAFHWGLVMGQFDSDYNNKNINFVGSFSDYDWCTGEVDRMNQVMRDAVYSTSSPVGIQDSIRVDKFHTRLSYDDPFTWYDNEPFRLEDKYYDGQWANMEPWASTTMDIDAAICHEIGHTTLAFPDIYGHPYSCYNNLLKDADGNFYGDTPLYPTVLDGSAPLPSAIYDNTDMLGVGYTPLMVGCHLWLDKYCSGICNHYVQQRTKYGNTMADIGSMIPSGEKRLKLLDLNDDGLKGAAVYMYQLVQSSLPRQDGKYLPDRPKFIGNTDENGYFVIPKYSDPGWDDWDTDEVEGSIYCWSPFHRVHSEGAGSNYFNGEYFVIKIVSGDRVEFQSLPQTEFASAYFSGNTTDATFTIKTSLTSVAGGTPAVSPTVPEAIRTRNLKPVAVVPMVIVRPGASFTLDASGSYDPEGQPLYYRWISPNICLTATVTGIAPAEEGDYPYQLYVCDGLRNSDVVTAILKVRANSNISGQVTDVSGNPVAGALVGVKRSAYATADADFYFVSDSNGKYSSDYTAPGNYYVSVWKQGYTPSADLAVSVKTNTSLVVNLKLGNPQDTNLALGLNSVAASNSEYGAPTLATDGSLDTKWNTKYWPDEPVSYYLDLGAQTEITDITIYRYYEINQYGGSADNYWVDVMTSGNPLDPSAWINNPSVSTVYSADRTLHGYPVRQDVAVDPIGVHLSNVRGIRIGMKSLIWPPDYRMPEIEVHGKYPAIVGKVIDPDGKPLSGALVGFKSTSRATADTDTYLITDSQGRYSLTTKRFTNCYVAAWKDGYCPSPDTVVNAANGAVVPDIRLDQVGVNMLLKTTKVGASLSYTGMTPTKAVDGDLSTSWRTTTSPSGSQYYYVDLGTQTNISDIVLYRYLQRNTSGDSRDTYQIDVMTSATANPLTASNWSNSANGVSTVYSAVNTIHGYEIQPNVAVDPTCLSLNGIRGIRIKFSGYHSPNYYDLKELQVHQTARYNEFSHISDVKNSNIGDYVLINGKTISALPGNGIPAGTVYVEEPDRSSGIRLDLSAVPGWTANVGNTVDARGLLTTTTDKEACIQITDWECSSGQPVSPLLMNLRAIGGGPIGIQDGPWNWKPVLNTSNGDYELQFLRDVGLNNIGLLVKICGHVTQIDPTGLYFYVDDGSGLIDGTKTGAVSNVGVRIPVDGRAYKTGRFTTVVGISSCMFWQPDGKIRGVVRPITIE